MKRKPSNFIVFDIGSSKIAAMEAQINKQGETRINSQILQYSEGFRSGNIINMELAENSIINAIYALEKECDRSVKEVAISLSGVGVKSYYIKPKMKLGNQPISKQDIKKLINKALSDFKVKDQQIIHHFPMEFVIDGNQVIDNPVGIYARELSCQLHIISADTLMLMNLSKCLAKCHVRVSDIILSTYASGVACLSPDEKELGAIIVDIGSHTTSFGVFLNNNIIYTGCVPIGGSNITIDIAKAFSVSMKAAEKLKILYGNASPNLLEKDISIRLGELEPGNNYNPDISISTGQLSEVIGPRMEEIILDIKKQYDHISMDHLLTQRMVITGGGAALPGVKGLFTDIFQKQVRIAKPVVVPGFAENYNPYIYSSIIGMVKLQEFIPNNYEDEGMLKKTFTWLKENI